MAAQEISKRINNPKYDAPDCVAPVEGKETMQQHNGFWISGTAVTAPPYTTYWETMGGPKCSSQIVADNRR